MAINAVRGREYGVLDVDWDRKRRPGQPAARTIEYASSASYRRAHGYGLHPCDCCDKTQRRLSQTGLVELGYVAVRELPPAEVKADPKEAARTALRLGREDLSLPPVTLHWYAPLDDWDRSEWEAGTAPWKAWCEEPDTMGFVYRTHPKDVWIRLDSSPRQTLYTVTHELKHVHDYLNYPAMSANPEYKQLGEDEAHEYGLRWVEWLDAPAATR